MRPVNRKSPDSSPDVQVAVVSGKTAVIVALITAVSGIVSGYFIKGASPDKVSPPIQRWLTIHSVSGEAGAKLKLVARVNTIPYSYPADAVMTTIGAEMSEQKCPLPIGENYTVSFEAYFRDSDEAALRNAKNREAPSFADAQLPVERLKYSLHEVIDGENVSNDKLTVTYSIR